MKQLLFVFIVFFLMFNKLEGKPKYSKKKSPYDAGPKIIDVSKYTPDMQRYYKIFIDKCGQCHTTSRPINSPYALKEEWEIIVARMQKKSDSGINSATADKICEFLVYDSSIRKKNIIEKKLSDLKEKTTYQDNPKE